MKRPSVLQSFLVRLYMSLLVQDGWAIVSERSEKALTWIVERDQRPFKGLRLRVTVEEIKP